MKRRDDNPKIGTIWRRRGDCVETRHVVERTLGGDVYYVSGRYYRGAYVDRCTFEEWNNWVWVHDAKEVRK